MTDRKADGARGVDGATAATSTYRIHWLFRAFSERRLCELKKHFVSQLSKLEQFSFNRFMFPIIFVGTIFSHDRASETAKNRVVKPYRYLYVTRGFYEFTFQRLPNRLVFCEKGVCRGTLTFANPYSWNLFIHLRRFALKLEGKKKDRVKRGMRAKPAMSRVLVL